MASTAFATQPQPEMVQPSGAPYAVRLLRISMPIDHLIVPPPPDEQLRTRTLPAQILLGTLSDPSFRVIRAIPTQLEVRDFTVIASWSEVDEFGTGASMSAACVDLGHTLAELYRSLEGDQDNLGPDLRRVLGLLREYIIHWR